MHGYVCEAANLNLNFFFFFFAKFITFVQDVTSREFTNSCKL